MANKEYIERLQMVINQLPGCSSKWAETVLAHEVFKGETISRVDVEVFNPTGHPKAKRAYASSRLDGKNDESTRFVAVLEIPPVESAETAVRLQIVKDAKGKK